MKPDELDRLSAIIGQPVRATRTLAGGFSHETCLLTLADGTRAVARLGGGDPAVEAAVMNAARAHVPVPEVLFVVPGGSPEPGGPAEQGRPAMVIEYVPGTPLSHVLGRDGDRAGEAPLPPAELHDLGRVVGTIAARIGLVECAGPGFFASPDLSVSSGPPWSRQLAGFAATCLESVPESRLDAATRAGWASLCAAHAGALTAIDQVARLVHADLNPKNLLVSRAADGWRVDAVLDWEFSFAGCPFADAANMVRFASDYPPGFAAGFVDGFAAGQSAGPPLNRPALPADWLYLGRVLDMFALSDLVTRPAGHLVADQAAEVIRRWVASDGPG
jgi:aminoglycoside phosphotransferase (APT) family kinase protein